ncbi:MAG TPA: SDR family oxidoreductase [Candidatus Lokiarchaeia archaeon]|nr:SDR family oxidoreductase [Candidatus Lokiarchaeia archaeon]
MSKQKQAKIVFITGCSSGFGYLTAKLLVEAGYKVYATMRDLDGRNKQKKEELEAAAAGNGVLKVLECDVLDETSVNAAVAEVIATESRIDVLVNNAGYGLYGPIELATDEVIRNQFETNVLGYIRVIKAVMPHMREHRGGHVINVGSMFSVMSLPMCGYYVATKYAIRGMSEALLGEGYLFNIRVSLVCPMGYGTDFLHRSLRFVTDVESSGEYKSSFKDIAENIDNFGKSSGDPIAVAKKIAAIIKKKNPPFLVFVGKFARMGYLLAKLLPIRTMHKIIAKQNNFPHVLEKVPLDGLP